jgi:hypothetical protein
MKSTSSCRDWSQRRLIPSEWIILISLFSWGAWGQDATWITIQERAGVNRSNECVTFGVPLPRSWQANDTAKMRLARDDGQLLPAQFEILSRWGSDAGNASAPAKWVLVSYPETLPAAAIRRVQLVNLPGTSPSAPKLSITSSSPHRLIIDTGPAVFELNTNAFNLFEQVTVGGMPVLASLPASNAIVYRDLDGASVVAPTTNRPPRTARVLLERAGPIAAVVQVTGSLWDARQRANLIFAYLEGYRQTGADRWLAALRSIVGATANLTDKTWLSNPTHYRPPEDWQWLSSFQLSQVTWTLGRYLDFCEEFGIQDDLGVTNALVAYADFILRFFTQEYRPGRAAAWNAFYFYEPHEDPYLEINDWALVTADAWS